MRHDNPLQQPRSITVPRSEYIALARRYELAEDQRMQGLDTIQMLDHQIRTAREGLLSMAESCADWSNDDIRDHCRSLASQLQGDLRG